MREQMMRVAILSGGHSVVSCVAHPVAPTEMGRKVIDRAKVVLYNAEQIAEMTRSEKEVLSGPLRIALISTVSPVLVPGLFKYFGQHYPSISLAIRSDFIHEAKLNAVADAIKHIIPGTLLEKTLLNGHLVL